MDYKEWMLDRWGNGNVVIRSPVKCIQIMNFGCNRNGKAVVMRYQGFVRRGGILWNSQEYILERGSSETKNTRHYSLTTPYEVTRW